jgi:hypothetical protein
VTEVERGDLVDAAYALLMAAILLRDMAGAMPAKTFVAMPPDIADRLMWTGYQDAFDRLPADVRGEARARVLADPAVVAARALDAANGLRA